jgi:DNA-binding response OmpR family regulator
VDLVLVLERSDAAGARLASWAEAAGHEVATAGNGAEARHLVETRSSDVLVFDPAVEGDELASELRSHLPALALLAWLPVYSSLRAAELLERGSDDILHGALPEREALARLDAAARRARRPGMSAAVELGPLRVDAAHGEASWRGDPVRLTRRERQVLQVLAEAEGRVVRREEIYRRVWGYAMARGDRTVDVNVRRLRAKLAGAVGEDLAVTTQPGIGYRLELSARDTPVTVL